MQIKAQRYSGQLQAPASKSHGQRLLILAALSNNACQIQNLGADRDTKAMQAALNHFNQHSSNRQEVVIDVGESGFALRTLAFVASHFCSHYRLTGHGTLLKRTHWSTIHLLEQLGLKVTHQNGQLPLAIEGEVSNTQINVDGSEGSQYVSGLFLFAAKQPGSWQITVKNLNSHAYFEMTLAALNQFGFVYQQNGEIYSFEGAQELSCPEVSVEGDWSSVAVHLVGASIRGEIRVSGLNPESLQPDQNLLHALEQFGAKYDWNNRELFLSESKNKNPFEFDCTQQPDLFPVLVVLACAAHGTSSIKGIHRLKNKESDRLHAMCEALDIWGIPYHIVQDQIEIHGSGKIKSGCINTYNDHRIVMAACIANLLSNQLQMPEDTSAVLKSYPGFMNDFERLLQG